jgi:Flp pilus assembly CpaF family ATPase
MIRIFVWVQITAGSNEKANDHVLDAKQMERTIQLLSEDRGQRIDQKERQ